jgi:hypothetical protein
VLPGEDGNAVLWSDRQVRLTTWHGECPGAPIMLGFDLVFWAAVGIVAIAMALSTAV